MDGAIAEIGRDTGRDGVDTRVLDDGVEDLDSGLG